VPLFLRRRRRHADTRQAAGAVRWSTTSQEIIVLYTIALILLILWLIGALGAYTAGGLLHLLLVAAIVIVLYQLITGRRAP
jgi:hypothetical protein